MERLHDPAVRGFASDNASGAHPDVLAALGEASTGHVMGYGADPYTRRLEEVVRGHFGEHAETAVLLTGTGANVVALQALTRRWESVVCSDVAHVLHDEGGAPEHVGGIKLLPAPSEHGRIHPGDLARLVADASSPMAAPAGALTLTQSTELGTSYGLQETVELVRTAHELGLRVHVDGARLANAAVFHQVGLGELTSALGVDVVSLGATKNGALMAEAVVVLNPGRAPGVARLRKQSLQLASKARYVSAQLLALLEGNLWWENAAHANACAVELADRARAAGIALSRPVEANAVFALLPPEVADRAAAEVPFHVWDTRPEAGDGLVEVRWVCSWDTRPEDVTALLSLVAPAAARAGVGA
ncbi:threonine aldolase family protein [Kineococcus gynurae]|uniref:Threonine aldolase family protein n=1 Tax=Kineococcus gynurae TaxID=452979 RepID=A0ABV5LMT9_9ACTN